MGENQFIRTTQDNRYNSRWVGCFEEQKEGGQANAGGLRAEYRAHSDCRGTLRVSGESDITIEFMFLKAIYRKGTTVVLIQTHKGTC